MLRPSQKLNPSYGFLWWLNAAIRRFWWAAQHLPKLIARAPDDLVVAALGALGRKVYVWYLSLGIVATRIRRQQ